MNRETMELLLQQLISKNQEMAASREELEKLCGRFKATTSDMYNKRSTMSWVVEQQANSLGDTNEREAIVMDGRQSAIYYAEYAQKAHGFLYNMRTCVDKMLNRICEIHKTNQELLHRFRVEDKLTNDSAIRVHETIDASPREE